jgi:hypothetical protein
MTLCSEIGDESTDLSLGYVVFKQKLLDTGDNIPFAEVPL